MSRHTFPTEGARTEQDFRYAVPADARDVSPEVLGGTARVRVMLDSISLGYKSNYQPTPARWIVAESFRPDGSRFGRQCWRYTGKRFPVALTDAAKIRGDLIGSGCLTVAA